MFLITVRKVTQGVIINNETHPEVFSVEESGSGVSSEQWCNRWFVQSVYLPDQQTQINKSVLATCRLIRVI